ncbi:hypothetical protein [Lyngbya aestuarii]|uniref:hypothetical protein n=1 Tax=Lyngbya aestuarii TaxID=118322 RepID=UPI00403DA575
MQPLLLMLPYAIALLALVGLAGKFTRPAALGGFYDQEIHDNKCSKRFFKLIIDHN